jgi:hypothetical protein
MRAGKLDEFCAAVDIQFVLHVVEAGGGVFAGTKLRGVAEAAGLALEGDGVFRARDEGGGELFTVANLGAERPRSRFDQVAGDPRPDPEPRRAARGGWQAGLRPHAGDGAQQMAGAWAASWSMRSARRWPTR